MDELKIIALDTLRLQIAVALTCPAMKDMTPEEQLWFSINHPDAHFVIGDFEIKCLHPEKYGL